MTYFGGLQQPKHLPLQKAPLIVVGRWQLHFSCIAFLLFLVARWYPPGQSVESNRTATQTITETRNLMSRGRPSES
jgi:hypothetical protein